MGIEEARRGPTGKPLPSLKLDPGEVEKRLRAFFPATPAVLAYLFGSFAQQTAGPGSDLDIAVLLEGDSEELYSAYRRLLLGLRDALRTERFDLLLLNAAPPTLRFEVVTTGRVLYARSDQELNEFEEDSIRKYQDTAYLRAVQEEYLRRRARAWYSESKA